MRANLSGSEFCCCAPLVATRSGASAIEVRDTVSGHCCLLLYLFQIPNKHRRTMIHRCPPVCQTKNELALSCAIPFGHAQWIRSTCMPSNLQALVKACFRFWSAGYRMCQFRCSCSVCGEGTPCGPSRRTQQRGWQRLAPDHCGRHCCGGCGRCRRWAALWPPTARRSAAVRALPPGGRPSGAKKGVRR